MSKLAIVNLNVCCELDQIGGWIKSFTSGLYDRERRTAAQKVHWICVVDMVVKAVVLCRMRLANSATSCPKLSGSCRCWTSRASCSYSDDTTNSSLVRKVMCVSVVCDGSATVVNQIEYNGGVQRNIPKFVKAVLRSTGSLLISVGFVPIVCRFTKMAKLCSFKIGCTLEGVFGRWERKALFRIDLVEWIVCLSPTIASLAVEWKSRSCFPRSCRALYAFLQESHLYGLSLTMASGMSGFSVISCWCWSCLWSASSSEVPQVKVQSSQLHLKNPCFTYLCFARAFRSVTASPHRSHL